MLSRSVVLLISLICSVQAAERWQAQYFHDVDREELKLLAIAFCSTSRGVASGVLSTDRSVKAVAMVTSNGGSTWTKTELDEPGYAVSFLDETSGWMLTESGIWFTDECGRNWRRIHKQRGLMDVRFVSRERGWAVGAGKTAIETFDGGKTWTKVKAVADLEVDQERTTFNVIEPVTPTTLVMVGRSINPRKNRIPLWLDPSPHRRKELPALSLTLETNNAGNTWSINKVSLFGRISKVRILKNGQGLALVEFDEYFEYPSELLTMNARAGSNTRPLRRKDLAITDIVAKPEYFAAGFQPPGQIFRSPVPGKVRILRSRDLINWTENPVDYRAVATRVMLAEAGGQLWAATDTGMILKFVQD